jgi:hypothetical protein
MDVRTVLITLRKWWDGVLAEMQHLHLAQLRSSHQVVTDPVTAWECYCAERNWNLDALPGAYIMAQLSLEDYSGKPALAHMKRKVLAEWERYWQLVCLCCHDKLRSAHHQEPGAFREIQKTITLSEMFRCEAWDKVRSVNEVRGFQYLWSDGIYQPVGVKRKLDEMGADATDKEKKLAAEWERYRCDLVDGYLPNLARYSEAMLDHMRVQQHGDRSKSSLEVFKALATDTSAMFDQKDASFIDVHGHEEGAKQELERALDNFRAKVWSTVMSKPLADAKDSVTLTLAKSKELFEAKQNELAQCRRADTTAAFPDWCRRAALTAWFGRLKVVVTKGEVFLADCRAHLRNMGAHGAATLQLFEAEVWTPWTRMQRAVTNSLRENTEANRLIDEEVNQWRQKQYACAGHLDRATNVTSTLKEILVILEKPVEALLGPERVLVPDIKSDDSKTLTVQAPKKAVVIQHVWQQSVQQYFDDRPHRVDHAWLRQFASFEAKTELQGRDARLVHGHLSTLVKLIEDAQRLVLETSRVRMESNASALAVKPEADGVTGFSVLTMMAPVPGKSVRVFVHKNTVPRELHLQFMQRLLRAIPSTGTLPPSKTVPPDWLPWFSRCRGALTDAPVHVQRYLELMPALFVVATWFEWAKD